MWPSFTINMKRWSESVDDSVRIELFVRSLSPRESRSRIESIVADLEDHLDAGALAEYRVLVTGRELPAKPADALTDYGTYLRGRVEAFQQWAAVTDRSLGSLFERHTVHSSITEEDYDAIVLPTVAMAEYDGRALRFVSPCQDGDSHVTVTDRLEVIASERAAGSDDEPQADADGPPADHGGAHLDREEHLFEDDLDLSDDLLVGATGRPPPGSLPSFY